MDTYLKLPKWTGAKANKTEIVLPEGQRPKPRVTSPLPVGTQIPAKTPFELNLEKSDAQVVLARDKADQKKAAKLAVTNAREGQGVKRAGEGFSKGTGKKTMTQCDASDLENSAHTFSGQPIKHTAEAVVPSPVVNIHSKPPNVDEVPNTRHEEGSQPDPLPFEDTSDGHSVPSPHHDHQFVPNWKLRNDLHMNTPRACREMLDNLATPAEDRFLRGLTNTEVMSRAYHIVGQSVLTQAEVLKRYDLLSHNFVELRNKSEEIVNDLDETRAALLREQQANADLSKHFVLIDSAHQGCVGREQELVASMKDVERERDEWRATASEHAEKIKTVENELTAKIKLLEVAVAKCSTLESEKANLTSQLGASEMDRKRVIREFIPVFVKRLHTSVEYRKSLAVPVQLCLTAGLLEGLRLKRKKEDVAALLSEMEGLDIEGSKHWEDMHRALFTMAYPYVEKVASSSHLPFSELLNLVPDVPPPEPVLTEPQVASDGLATLVDQNPPAAPTFGYTT